MTMHFTRRRFGALVLGSAMALVLPRPAAALTEAQAMGLVDTLVGEINAVIASGKSESAMIADFERIFRRHGDIPRIAATAMGNAGRNASNAQRRAFSDAFTGYIARKYGKRFREFIGGRLEVQGVRARSNALDVQTIAFLKGQSPFDVTFSVSDASGKPLFFNMFVEGINMLIAEREEIGAMLDRRRGDIDAMIADLKRAG